MLLWQLECPNLRDMRLARSSSANMRLQPASLGVKRGYSRVSYGGITWEINRGVGTAKEKTLECTLAVTTAQPADAYFRVLPRTGPAYSPSHATNTKCAASIGVRETHQRSLEFPSLSKPPRHRRRTTNGRGFTL